MESLEPHPGRFLKWEMGAKEQGRAQEPVNQESG